MMLLNRIMFRKVKNFMPCSCSILTFLQVTSIIALTVVLLSIVFPKKETFEETASTTPTTPVPSYPFTIVTKEEFVVQVNVSDFFTSLSEADLKARQNKASQGGEQYRNEYIEAFEELTDSDKTLLTRIVDEANRLTSSYKNLQQLEWRIAKVRNTIEYGLPHTIGNMIVISKDTLRRPEKEIVNTMIHEKLHVFQRMNRSSAQQWATSMGFRVLLPSEFATLNKDILQLRRSNPDLDKNTYVHEKSNLVMRQLYNSNSPTSIVDSKAIGIPLTGNYNPISLTNDLIGLPKDFYCQLEHPYEIMACLISEMITNESFVEKNNSNNYISGTLAWMRSEL
jgi:hypothetical protein